ncbi:hypothetical protein PTKIN_Ptkin09bG0199900 [Pterospermum kingtungense]
MTKKRKGSETDVSPEVTENFAPTSGSRSSNIRSHYSLEDYERIGKRCKEDVHVPPIGSCKSRLADIATAPPCCASSLVPPGRGLKRKIGCIEVITRVGRKKKIEDDYVKGGTIGQGKFGSVWLCRSRTSGVEFACKTLHKGEETVHREVEIMQHLSGHPGVVTLQAVYEEPDCFHLVMELCSGGRLIDQMAEGQYSEQRAANIFKDVMLVSKYCHEMGVVHRDIKPENILLTTSGKIKLADFGLAMRISNGQTLSGLAGSPAYVAPEVILGNYSEKVDIWSAGVLLHVLLIGVLPFQGDSLKAVFEAIKNVKLDFHSGIWESVSKPARDLLARMLTRDVSSRITADEVLRHPWILFYTECSLKTLSIKSKSKNRVVPSFQITNSLASKLSVRRIDGDSHSYSPLLVSTSNSSSCKSEEQDENGVVDALAVAISRVRISEPKRSRLCSPTGPIEQHCSSNLTANNLCRVF